MERSHTSVSQLENIEEVLDEPELLEVDEALGHGANHLPYETSICQVHHRHRCAMSKIFHAYQHTKQVRHTLLHVPVN